MWHVSIARIHSNRRRVLQVKEWTSLIHTMAEQMALDILASVGGIDWQKKEIGESAIHIRRRLSIHEMKQLHVVNRQCPVFTHGEAGKLIA